MRERLRSMAVLHLVRNKAWSPGSRAQRARGSSLISSVSLAPSLQRLAPPGLWPQCPSPAPHLALSQAPAMSPPLRALLLLALELGLAATLNPKDPNTCSFWER